MGDRVTEKIVEKISQINDLTIKGKLDWKRANPTTFVWRKGLATGDPYVISIQQTERLDLDGLDDPTEAIGLILEKGAQKKTEYIFMIKSANEQILTIETEKSSPTTRNLLSSLYSSISGYIEKKAIDVMDKLIRG